MNFLLKNSFIVDIGGSVVCIGYGLYTNDPWWGGGGLAGLAFSLVWKRVQPKLLGKFMRKAPASKAVVLDTEALNPLADPTASASVAPSAAPAAPTTEMTAQQRFHQAVNTWPAVVAKDGPIRFY